MQRPIHLALVITELHPGGAERCLVELATRIDRSLFAPVVYSLGAKPPPDRQSLVARLEQANVATRFLDLQSSWSFWSGVRRLAAMLRDDQIDLCQAFLFHANVLAARASLRAGVPSFVAGIRVADPRIWRSFVERVALSRAERIVCVSQSVAGFCRQRGFLEEKLVVIPNGIDVSLWQNAAPANLIELGVPPGRRVFTFVGRLDAQKGLDRFLEELPAVFQHLPAHDFLLVGEGPAQRALRQRCTQLNVESRVHFTDWRSDVPAILVASDLLVLPSRWEGLPNVVLEAMASRKPIAAMRAEGVVEVLGNDDDQTVPRNDFPKLAKAIIEILRNPTRANNLGDSNWNRVSNQFTLETMIGAYQRLYLDLCREKNIFA